MARKPFTLSHSITPIRLRRRQWSPDLKSYYIVKLTAGFANGGFADVCLPNKKGESRWLPPFRTIRNADLELISVGYISVQPVSTTPGSAVLINPEVFLDGSRQV